MDYETRLSELTSDSISDFTDSEEDSMDELPMHPATGGIANEVLDPTTSIQKCLYPGACIGGDMFSAVLVLFCQRHNLTYSCQNDLLKMLKVSFPCPNKVPSSLYAFIKRFVDLRQECEVDYFCGNCLDKLGTKKESCHKEACLRKREPCDMLH